MAAASLNDRVLVVDDDPSFLELAAAALDSVGLHSTCVRSAEEAQKLLADSLPRAVILDGLLPGMRGDELARRLREKHGPAALPILFVSAFYRDMRSYRMLTRECGVDLVMHKPLPPERIASAVLRVLRIEANAAAEVEERVLADIEVDLEGAEEEEAPPPAEGAELVQLRAEYLAASAERARELEIALTALAGRGGEDALHLLHVEAHRFRGSGASFGFPEISRLGGLVEDWIVGNEDLLRSASKRARLTGLVQALADKICKAAGASPIALERTIRPEHPRVLLVDEGSPLSRAAVAKAEQGLPIHVAGELDEALRLAVEERPDVVFVAAGVELEEACTRFRAAGASRVVALAEGESLRDRVSALASGAVGYVALPPDADTLLRIAAAYARPRIAANVVAVGGDRAALSSLAETLAPRGVAVEPCASADEFFRSLERAQPSLVILDGDLPDVRGSELLAVLRADLGFRDLPVVVLARSGGHLDRISAFEAGAVDWIEKSVGPAELAARIVARLPRGDGGRDPVTGLWSRSHLVESVAAALQLARREGRTLSLLGIDAGLSGLREAEGRLRADAEMMGIASRLVSSFRGSDVVARWGGDRLVALLHGAEREDAERLLRTELEWIRRSSGLEPVGAVVNFPEQTGGHDALLAALQAALGR